MFVNIQNSKITEVTMVMLLLMHGLSGNQLIGSISENANAAIAIGSYQVIMTRLLDR